MGSGNAIQCHRGQEVRRGTIRRADPGRGRRLHYGKVPDYQMASLLMAIFIHGLSYGETALTRAMAESGRTYSFPECVDKHSTGGVGDKVSLTALPIVAACGAPVAKLGARPRGDRWHDRQAGVYPRLLVQPLRGAIQEPGRGGRARIIEAGDLAPADKEIYASAIRRAQ